jgi:hypothetical protein
MERAASIERPRFDALREQSAAEIVAAIGDCADLTLVRGPGDLADELTCAGTRSLLSDRRFREIAVEELASSAGHTALLLAPGGFSRASHDWAPRALALAEIRFGRVIVLPASFDVSFDVVREALIRTRAVVFAREARSYEAIAPLCDARLALDGAFHYDYEPFRGDGRGVLDASRTGVAESKVDLLEWLSGSAVVRADVVPVMIAAALLGKQVEIGPSASSELDAIADYALGDFPLRRLRTTDLHESPAPVGTPRDGEFVLMTDRDAELTSDAIDRLAAELGRHPEALAAAPGGVELREWDGVLEFRLPHAVLVRASALARFPIDPEMREYANREWLYRVSKEHEDGFRSCPDTIAAQGPAPAPADPGDFRGRCRALPYLTSIAHFHKRHGLVMGDLFAILPTLTYADGDRNVAAARTVLTLLDAVGADLFLAMWAAGELDPLLDNQAEALGDEVTALGEKLDQARAESVYLSARLATMQSTRAWRMATAYWRLRDRVRAAARRS